MQEIVRYSGSDTSMLDDHVHERSTIVDSDMHSDHYENMDENQANILEKYQPWLVFTNCADDYTQKFICYCSVFVLLI